MKILKSFLFLIILFLLVEGIAYFLLPSYNIKKYGMYKTAAYEILGERENKIDVIALGDSLIYTSISPMEIWNQFGYTVFDCAEPAQIIEDSYHYLETAIESQHPKVVFMEAGVLFRDASKKPWYEKIIKKAKNFIPMITYHDNWKKIFSKNKEDNLLNVNKGYKYITTVKGAKEKDYMKYSKKQRQLPKRNLEYFEKIVELCKNNHVKLFLVSTPTQKSWNYPRHLGTTKLAEKYEIPFIDLNLDNPLSINWKQETKDRGSHLNYLGAKKVSIFIGNYLKNTNLVENHRMDSNYSDWEYSYTIYQKMLKEN